MLKGNRAYSFFGSFVALLLVLFIVGCLYGCPKYNVYSQRQEGMAQLAMAESNRQITVLEAKSKMESAVMLADAEVERAKGVKQANEIIASGLGGPAGYLKYLQIQALEETSKESKVIYVPTEAGLPILEARK